MRIVVFLIAILAVACKDKPKTEPVANPQPTGSGSQVAPAPDRVPTPPTPPQAGPTTIELPKLSGKAPAATKTKLSKAQLEALSKIELKDFKRDVRKLEPSFLLVKQKIDSRPKITTEVTVLPCMDCLPMQLDKWKAKADGLKVQLLPPELREQPDTTFELGDTELAAGTKAIYAYLLGYHFGKDDTGNPAGAYANSYALYYNNGVNQIRVVASYSDDPLASKEDLVRAVPREQLEKIAKAVLDVYTQAWGN
ncbi:MAG TPA: hypothetical protein VFQ53_35535 [Kofleriaceae bacterium]|nr:hypothetical protein [Kofleriaceae bacterium]